MALDLEMMNSRGEMSPMMRVAQSDPDSEMRKILELLRQQQMQQLRARGSNWGGGATTPMGQPMPGPMDMQGAPPGYRLNQAPADPRLMQALMMRQQGG